MTNLEFVVIRRAVSTPHRGRLPSPLNAPIIAGSIVAKGRSIDPLPAIKKLKIARRCHRAASDCAIAHVNYRFENLIQRPPKVSAGPINIYAVKFIIRAVGYKSDPFIFAVTQRGRKQEHPQLWLLLPPRFRTFTIFSCSKSGGKPWEFFATLLTGC